MGNVNSSRSKKNHKQKHKNNGTGNATPLGKKTYSSRSSNSKSKFDKIPRQKIAKETNILFKRGTETRTEGLRKYDSNKVSDSSSSFVAAPFYISDDLQTNILSKRGTASTSLFESSSYISDDDVFGQRADLSDLDINELLKDDAINDQMDSNSCDGYENNHKIYDRRMRSMVSELHHRMETVPQQVLHVPVQDITQSPWEVEYDDMKGTSQSIEYMVGAYSETIERLVQAKEILMPLRDVIGEYNYDVLNNRLDSTSGIDVMKSLLTEIRKSNTNGKWQLFVNTLRNEGYVYVANLLECRTEKDHNDTREILFILGPDLLNKLHVKECVDRLFERAVLSEGDKEEIQQVEKQSGPIAATRVLINKIPRRSQEWNREFAYILSEHGLKDAASLLMFEQASENNASALNVPTDDRTTYNGILRFHDRNNHATTNTIDTEQTTPKYVDDTLLPDVHSTEHTNCTNNSIHGPVDLADFNDLVVSVNSLKLSITEMQKEQNSQKECLQCVVGVLTDIENNISVYKQEYETLV